MWPLVSEILIYLFGTFTFGMLLGWLVKEIFANRVMQRQHRLWEEHLSQQQQELEFTQRSLQTKTEQLHSLEEQLSELRTSLTAGESKIALFTHELATKESTFSALTAQISDLQQRLTHAETALLEERQQTSAIEQEVRTLRRNLTDKTEALLQMSQQCKEQEQQTTKLREHEADLKMLNVRLQTTLQSKELEVTKLQDQVEILETRNMQLTDSNRKLRHSCARYQEDLQERDEDIEHLQARLKKLDPTFPSAPLPPSSGPDLQSQMNVRYKDTEIARLRARISGLQLLLRHGVGRQKQMSLVSSGVPVDLAHDDLSGKH